jgi:hypothetical protein
MASGNRALIIVDEAVPAGEYHIGGVVLLPNDPIEVGFALTGGVVRVGSDVEAEKLEKQMADEGLECLRSKQRFPREQVGEEQ